MWLIQLFVSIAIISGISCLGEIIFALNAGGDATIDSHGIRYRRDYLSIGTASDYGKSLDIKRVGSNDKLIYQTERYASESFGYSIPMPSESGDYVVWLKFSEVWFNAPNQKVFHVALNDQIVIKDLDIFARAGRGVAHDEIVPFTIKQNKIIIGGKTLSFNNELRVEFVKTELDNPKINAIIIMKGTPDQVPALEPYEPELPNQQAEEDEEIDFNDPEQEELLRRRMREAQEHEEEERESLKPRKKASPGVSVDEPVVEDPYANDESSFLIPVLVAIGAFIPLLFCLCKI